MVKSKVKLEKARKEEFLKRDIDNYTTNDENYITEDCNITEDYTFDENYMFETSVLIKNYISTEINKQVIPIGEYLGIEQIFYFIDYCFKKI